MSRPTPIENVVEMDAMDVAEWERDRLTPLQQDANLAALVKQTAPKGAEPPPVPRKTSTISRVVTENSIPRVIHPAAGAPTSIPAARPPTDVTATARPAPAAKPAIRSVKTIARAPSPAKAHTPAPIAKEPATAPIATAPIVKPSAIAPTPIAKEPATAPTRQPTAPMASMVSLAPILTTPAPEPVPVVEPTSDERPLPIAIAPELSDLESFLPDENTAHTLARSRTQVKPAPARFLATAAHTPIPERFEPPTIAPAPIAAIAPPIAPAPIASWIVEAAPLPPPPVIPPPVIAAPAPAPGPTYARIDTQQPEAEWGVRPDTGPEQQFGERTRTTDSLPAITGRSRRPFVIVGSAIGVVAVVMVIALSGGKHEAPAPAAEVASVAPVTPVAAPAPAPIAEAPVAAVAAPAPIAEAVDPVAKPGKQVPVKRIASGGKRKLVLEYDHPADNPQPAPKDDAAVVKARAAYAAGNQRLFAGDPEGAIRAYHQALAFYPSYIAGYRGLGLAYAQEGDKTRALQSLRMYITAVPTAKDAGLIRKRIARLSQ